MPTFLILGCGYTGERLARRLIQRGCTVYATSRTPDRLSRLAELGATVWPLEVTDPSSIRQLRRSLEPLEPGLRLLWSIPTTGPEGIEGAVQLLRVLEGRQGRIVYLSSTSVYGAITEVDERTLAAPDDSPGRWRLETEQALAGEGWSTLVLRPAAIYGPGRGLHAMLKQGRLGRVRELDRPVSRVYVDDLVTLAEAALRSELEGSYPVADDEPATTRELIAFCEGLGLVAPPTPPDGPGSMTIHRGRRVDGRAIRQLLGVALRHPSYRTGIPAALEQERLAEWRPTG